ncbi:MAG: WD40 repeat domain-containing protein [Cyanobacteria bacterium J06558_2]
MVENSTLELAHPTPPGTKKENPALKKKIGNLPREEQNILYWLVLNRGWVLLPELKEDLLEWYSDESIVDIINRLAKSFEIKKEKVLRESLDCSCKYRWSEEEEFYRYRLQDSELAEYLLAQFAGIICHEIETENINWLNTHALLKVDSYEWLSSEQAKYIIDPIIRRLQEKLGSEDKVEKKLDRILEILKDYPLEPIYAPGNIINLLLHLKKGIIKDKDLSHLTIWQGNFLDAQLHNVNLSFCDLTSSKFINSKLGMVLTVDISKDNHYLVTGDCEGYVRVWDISTGEQVAESREHQDWVWVVRFSPDGKVIASGSDDGNVRIWYFKQEDQGNVISNHPNRHDNRHNDSVRALNFTEDGRLLASGSGDKVIKIWKINSRNEWKFECDLKGHQQSVRSVSFNTQGTLLASASVDGTIRVWDIGRNKEIERSKSEREYNEYEDNSLTVRCVAFHPDDSRFLISGHDDCYIRIWQRPEQGKLSSLQSLEKINEFKAHDNWIRAITFSSDGELIISGGEDSSIKIWQFDRENPKAKPNKPLNVLKGHQSWVHSIRCSSDSKYVVSGSVDHSARVWDIASGKCLRVFKGYANWVLSTVFSPDGKYIISSHGDYKIRFWDTTSYERVREIPGHRDIVRSLAISSHEGKTILASGSADRLIKLWDIDFINNKSNDILIKNLSDHISWVRSVSFDPNNPKILASCSDDKTIQIRNIENGQFLSLHGHTDPVRTIAFSPDSRYLISGSGDKTVLIWERETTNNLQQEDSVPQYQCLNKENPINYGDWVWSLVFLDHKTFADDKIFAVGGGSKDVRFYKIIDSYPYCESLNIDQDSKHYSGISHDHPIKILTYCRETGWLASGGIDGKVRLCKCNFLKQDKVKCHLILEDHRILGNHGSIIRALAFSPDGETLLSGGQDGTIRVWKVDSLQKDTLPLKTLSVDLPYKNTNIENCLGISDYQEEILQSLGASENKLKRTFLS